MKHVNIGRISLRLAGLPPEVARLVADGLGREVLEQLDRQPDVWKSSGVRHIERLAPGPVHAVGSTSPLELRRQIAMAIAQSIVGAAPNRARVTPVSAHPSRPTPPGESSVSGHEV